MIQPDEETSATGAPPDPEQRPSPLRLSRQVGDRILLGVMATPLLLASVGALFALRRAEGPSNLVVRIILNELAWLVFCISGLSMLWAMATPRFVERLLEKTALRVALAVFLVNAALLLCLVYLTFS